MQQLVEALAADAQGRATEVAPGGGADGGDVDRLGKGEGDLAPVHVEMELVERGVGGVGDGVAVRSFARTVRGTGFRDAERFLGVRSELAGSHGPHLAVGPHTLSRLGPPHLPTASIRLLPDSWFSK